MWIVAMERGVLIVVLLTFLLRVILLIMVRVWDGGRSSSSRWNGCCVHGRHIRRRSCVCRRCRPEVLSLGPMPLTMEANRAPRPPGRILEVVVALLAGLPLRLPAAGVTGHGILAAEALEVGLHVAEAEVVPADPVVDGVGDGLEAGGVTAVVASLEAAGDEEEAVDHLVDKGGDEEAAVVLRVLEDGGAQDDEGLVAAELCAAAQGRGADNVLGVLVAGLVAPVPCDAAGQPVGEEQVVGGGEER